MKRRTSALIVLCSLLAFGSTSYGQDAAINILFQPASIAVGDTGTVQVDIDNNSFVTNMPTNKLIITINLLNSGVAYIPNSPLNAGVGSNPNNWALQSNSGSAISLINTQTILTGDRSTFFIKVVATATGASGFNGTITFNGAATPGNATANDQATTSVTITPAIPLPVSLLSFTAKESGCDAVLNWETGAESGFHHFDVEKSTDGSHYISIAQLKARGTGSSYSYTDMQPQQGSNQYRLKMTDNDGSARYSGTLPININCATTAISLFPNPVQDIVSIKGLQGNESLQLLDMTGRSLSGGRVQGTTASLNMAALADGMYQILVTSPAGKMQTFKVIKKK